MARSCDQRRSHGQPRAALFCAGFGRAARRRVGGFGAARWGLPRFLAAESSRRASVIAKASSSSSAICASSASARASAGVSGRTDLRATAVITRPVS